MSRYRGAPPTTLYVRNISDRVRYDDLRRLFQKYGKIVDVTIPLDYYSGLPKGYCFVEYEDPRDAEEAQYRMDRQRLFGREIEVEFARGDRKSAGEMRTRDKDRRYMPERRGGGRMDEYDRGHRGGRSRSRSRSRGNERRGGERRPADNMARSKSREASYSRSKSRSASRNRTPSPRNNNNHTKSMSRDRSRSPRDRSADSRKRGMSPRRGEARSAKMMTSRSPSPA